MARDWRAPGPDLDYTHERLYRAVTGMMDHDGTWNERLESAQLDLCALDVSDFPEPCREQFKKIMEIPAEGSEEAAEAAARSLWHLFLAISEQVVNSVTLGKQYDEPAWAVRQAREGHGEPLRKLMERYYKRNQPDPPEVREFLDAQMKGETRKRRGPKSLHPAETVAIALLVESRLRVQKLHNPKTSLNVTCQHLSSFIGKSWEVIKAAYLAVSK